MVLISVESENGATLTYRLAKNQVSVGSSGRNDVVVRAAGLAEKHLVIQRSGDVFTFVTSDRQFVVLNGERRARGVLNPGDKLRIGAATLIFRGGVEGLPEDEAQREAVPVAPPAKIAVADAQVRVAPGAFAELRAALLEQFAEERREHLQRLVAALHEAFARGDVAVVAPGEGDVPIALASQWTGDLPRLERRVMTELGLPGRYAVLESPGGQIVVQPVLTRGRELVALLLARPLGSLGDEGVTVLGEVARLLGIQWREVERDDRAFAGWELEAKHRLETIFPGSSQAVQILRAGILATAHSNDPVLICGAPGAGKTEVARVLATIGPVGGRPVVVFDAREGDADALRAELFGEARRPTLVGEADGLVGRARGGLLVVRNADRLPETMQVELAGLISVLRRDELSSTTVRWVVTCGEDPLALVQTGRLAPALFMALAQRMLRVPRLSERREDLPLLIAALMRRAAAEQGKTVRGVTLECLNALLAAPYPREMEELVGEINRLVTSTPSGEMVRCEGLVHAVGTIQPAAQPGGGDRLAELLAGDNLKEMIPAIEQHVIDRVMRRVKGNQSEGARLLGISRGALIAKLKEFGIPDYRYLRRRREKSL